MSRSNLRTARQIREAESLQFRKAILKGSGNSALDQERMTKLMSQSNSDYNEKINKLNNFKNKNKAAMKSNSHKIEWCKEQEQLRHRATTAEQDLEMIMEKIFIESGAEGIFIDENDEEECSTKMTGTSMRDCLLQFNDNEGGDDGTPSSSSRLVTTTPHLITSMEASKRLELERIGLVEGIEQIKKMVLAVKSSKLEKVSSEPENIRDQELSENSQAPANKESSTLHSKEETNGFGNTREAVWVEIAEGDMGHSKGGGDGENQKEKLQTPEAATVQVTQQKQNSEDAPAPTANSIMADLLLQVHSSIEFSRKILSDTERKLSLSISLYKKKVLSSMRLENSKFLQYSSIAAELEQFAAAEYKKSKTQHKLYSEVNVEGELQLFVEETLHKLYSIIRSHEEMVFIVEQQMASVSQKFGGCDSLGDWKEEDHLVFKKVYRRAESAGQSRKVVLEQYKVHLPHITYETIDIHEEWYRATKVLHIKKQELIQAHTARMKEAVQAAKADIEKFSVKCHEDALVERENTIFNEKRQELHLSLQQQRANKEVEKALKQREIECVEEEERQRRELELFNAKARAAEMHAQVEQFKSKQAEIRQREEALIREREAKEKTERKKQVEMNKEKVEIRGLMLLEKEEAKKRKEEELMLKERKKMELLEKLVEQCPYYEGLQNATSKLHQPTAFTTAAQYYKGEDFTRGHIPLFGFADKNVVKDIRFKLITALRSAGVAQSDYARMAIQRINPQPHLAIHGIL